MSRTFVTRAIRTLGASLLLAMAIPAMPVAASGDVTVRQAENRALAGINALREANGLVPVRMDPRMNAITRTRTELMARTGVVSHDHNGKAAWDLMTDAGIKWYDAGEIIGWNNWPTLADSADQMVRMWKESAPHYEIVKQQKYNYVGVSLSLGPEGKKMWAVVFLQGPDRTAAVAQMNGANPRTSGDRTSSTSARIRLSWDGADVLLSSYTAGLKDFQVSVRVDGGRWKFVTRSTTVRSRTVTVGAGHTYQFRVRARDNAGNVGRWSAPKSVSL